MKWLYLNKYQLIVICISVMVAFLTHLPEMIALSGDGSLFPGMRIADVINEVIFTFFSLLLLFYLNLKLFRFHLGMVHIGWKQLLVSYILTWAMSSLLGKGFVYLHHYANIPAIDAMLHHYLHPLRDFLISSIVVGSCHLMHLSKKSRIVLLDNQQLRTENLINQYEALKSQLNPHMLFNSLNTLYSLIRENSDKAQHYVQELSKVLRYTLQDNESHSVSLEEEMKFVHSYIYLLKMRYEDNLNFSLQIEQDALPRRLPPMAIQMLIENAVKHNEISNRNPLLIYVQATANRVEVSNHLQPKLTTDSSTQIGLDNLSKRYRLLFKQDIEVKTENECFTVILPLV